MGRSYWFECPNCGYRANVSGRADRGLSFCVQTILCLDCKELYDAVSRIRIPDQSGALGHSAGLRQAKSSNPSRSLSVAPSFQSVLNRLPYTGVKRFRWLPFQIQCPVSPRHRVQSWNEPDQCPRCGIYLEKNVLPFRIWD
jgi:Zn-finger nucleic acid-binding protein